MTSNGSNSNFKIVNTLDEKVWRQFVASHSQSNVFHTPEMFQVFTQAKGHEPSLWGVVNSREQVLALLLPVLVTLKNSVLSHLTARAIMYGGILCVSEPEGHEALTVLLKAYTKTVKHKAIFTEIRHLSDTSFAQLALTTSGFGYEDHLNYLVDLDMPIKEIWQGISKSGRKAIRRSESRGVVFEQVQDRSLIPIHYDLLRQTYARAKVPLADISLFEAVFDILVPKGMAKMLLARVGDRYVAASLEIPYKDVIYSWYSGYDQSFRTVYPNDGLVWHILEWGAKNGYRYFDFGGAGRPNEDYGPRNFKAKFGGQLVNFGRHVCVHAPIRFVLGRVGYAVYRKISRYLSMCQTGISWPE